MIKTSTLASGLRVITESVPHVDTVAGGISVHVGSRYEEGRQRGISHFLEHMAFKGTETLSVRQLRETFENYGLYYNAFTGFDATRYVFKCLKDDWREVFALWADMLLHPSMPEAEVEKERGVIFEEMLMYEDSPDQQLHMGTHSTEYPGQDFGEPIIGTRATVEGISRADLLDFKRRMYAPEGTIISLAGNMEHEAVVAEAEKLYGGWTAGAAPSHTPAVYGGGAWRKESDELQQYQCNLAWNGCNCYDSDRFALQTAAMVLGLGMSSRLFARVREELGLAYSIHSSAWNGSDHGIFSIHFKTSPANLAAALSASAEETKRLLDGITASELQRAKNNVKYRLASYGERINNLMENNADDLRLYGRVISREELFASYDAVSAEDAVKALRRVLGGGAKLTYAVIGPKGEAPAYDDVAAQFAV
ncbi:peptidase M16 [Alphaproteobacteria bacterium]|nr:peptidase M16 [Alphaproteobacteria bacterium]